MEEAAKSEGLHESYCQMINQRHCGQVVGKKAQWQVMELLGAEYFLRLPVKKTDDEGPNKACKGASHHVHPRSVRKRVHQKTDEEGRELLRLLGMPFRRS